MQWRKELKGEQTLIGITAIGVVLILFSFYQSSYWLMFLGTLLLVTSRMSVYYLNHVSDNLIFANERETLRLSVDEEGSLPLSFTQHSRLSILHAELFIKLENIVDVKDAQSYSEEENVIVKVPFVIRGRQTILLSVPIQAVKRGASRIKSIDLKVSNFFGLGAVYLKYQPLVLKEIIVHPILISVPQAEKLTAAMHQGDYPALSSLYEQMLAPIGTRDYVYSDSFKRIHWKASARTQVLQTKIYERTTHFSWTVVMNLRDPDAPQVHLGIVDNLESIVSNVAYLLKYAAKHDIEYELFINLRMAVGSPVLHLPKGSGTRQLAKALDILARINDVGITVKIDRLLHYVEKHQQFSPVVIMCGPYEDQGDFSIAKMQKNGQRVFMLFDDEIAPAIVPLGR